MDGVREAMDRLLASAGAAAVSVETRVGTVLLHHLEAGDGVPVVLVHGGSGGGANWFRVLPLLGGGIGVYAPDLPGFGLSDAVRPERRPGAQAARLLAAWADAHGVRDAVWAGTSFGGLVAMHVRRQRPDLCRALFLLSSAGLGRRIHPAVGLATLPLLDRVAARPSRAGTRFLFRTFLTTDRTAIPSAQQDALIEYLYMSALRTGVDYAAHTLRLFTGPRGQRDVWDADALRALDVPVHVMWGRRDRLLSVADALALARAAPWLTLELLEGVGHSPNWESPDAVARSLRGLATRHGTHDVAAPDSEEA